jgi:GDP-mannose 6-dehydrogenase
MRVLVWGLGHVGTVTAACLAEAGHEVLGIEPELATVQAINAGHSPVVEPGLVELVGKVVAAGRLRGCTDAAAMGPWGAVSLVCVGTPATADGSGFLDQVSRVAPALGACLRQQAAYHVVALRSTVFPGVTRGILGALLERHSGLQAGQEFGLVHHPEFLRTGSALADFRAPAYTILGELDPRAGNTVAALFGHLPAPIYRLGLEEAELLKLVTNAFHGLKVGFANEVGRLCTRLNLDSGRIMDLLCADTRLNISPAYLRPGFAFGGSCLSKDLHCLTSQARALGVPLPIVEAVLPSNQLQIDEARRRARDMGARRVGVLGLGNKPGSDDVRGSPVVELIGLLVDDGMEVLAFDPDVSLDRLGGSNLEYLHRRLPQARDILCHEMQSVLDRCDLLIVGQDRLEFVAAVRRLRGHGGPPAVLDLARLDGALLEADAMRWAGKAHGGTADGPAERA